MLTTTSRLTMEILTDSITAAVATGGILLTTEATPLDTLAILGEATGLRTILSDLVLLR